jgi:hypothetical protein
MNPPPKLMKVIIMSITKDNPTGQHKKSCDYPQVLDNRQVNYAMNPIEPGMSCKTCTHFNLVVPLDEDEKLPIKKRVDYDEHEMIDIKGALIHLGFCIQPLVNVPPIIINNVRSDQGCARYVERPSWTQFDDDGVGVDNDPYEGPVIPTMY